jgi:hypothetical protein
MKIIAFIALMSMVIIIVVDAVLAYIADKPTE